MLSVNDAFTSKLFRVKVPLISASSAGLSRAGSGASAADELDAEVAQQIENQRKTMLEASIVRIMKSRKSMDHTNLVMEVTRQLSNRFKPSPAEIKKRIEDLIERDYLERDATDKRIYSYMS
jgi:cullin 3